MHYHYINLPNFRHLLPKFKHKGGVFMNELFLRENILEILDYIEEGIHIIDKNGRIIYYNKFAQNIDGIERDKTTGRHLLITKGRKSLP